MPRVPGVLAPLALAVALAAPACGAAVGEGATAGTTLPTTAPLAPPPADGAVLVLGDSLTHGAQRFGGLADRLDEAGFDEVDVIAEIGRDVGWALDEVDDLATVPEVVVVELGTNPSAAADGFGDQVTELIDALRTRGAVRIAWLTPVHGRDDRYDEKAAVLAATPGIDLVADWAEHVRDDPERLAADGLHPTRAGYADLARFLVATASTLAAG